MASAMRHETVSNLAATLHLSELPFHSFILGTEYKTTDTPISCGDILLLSNICHNFCLLTNLDICFLNFSIRQQTMASKTKLGEQYKPSRWNQGDYM